MIVKSDLSLAKSFATRRNQNCEFAFSGLKDGGNDYEVRDQLNPNNVLLERSFQNDYDWNDVNVVSANSPIFRPNGTILNISSIVISNSAGSMDITMTMAGRVRIN